MHRIILFGPPTAGKSTLAARVSARLGLAQINVGELLRRRSRDVPDMALGKAVDDDTVIELVAEALHDCPAQGFILEGFPRNLRQLDYLETRMRATPCRYIQLDLDLRLVPDRFLARKNCRHCKTAVYPRDNEPAPCHCSRCGRPLTVRADANPQALEKKMHDFLEHEVPIMERLRAQGRLLPIRVRGELEQDLDTLLNTI